ncbi:MAG: hypothetical protein H6582_05335 [Crocinitomicaceae bacterium]|nr:hypothetical protein [Crocinitomicaceae bacterium]
MNIKNIIGIITIVLAVSMLTLTFMLVSQGIMFKAAYLKMAMANLYLLIVFSGLYLVETFSNAQKGMSRAIQLLGIMVMFFGVMVSFNWLDFKTMWNIPLIMGVVYITLIELQLLKWEKSKHLLKILGLLTIVSNTYIFAFFLFKLSMIKMGFVFDIAIITSVFSFLIGLMLSNPLKKKDRSGQNIA